MKITVIGGGGVRSMFLAKTLAQVAERLNIKNITFMDNDEEKLAVFGTMAKEVAGLNNPNIDFVLTCDPIEAVKNADYIITTIRVGQDVMRIKDERIALNLGVLGQETTGAAGFSFAMRSVPALAEYCELAKKYAGKNVKIFNFTNPAGVVSQTLRDMGYDFTFGICDAPTSLLRSIAGFVGAEPNELEAECFGLNHLSFFNSIKYKGKNLLPQLLENQDLFRDTDMKFFQPELAKHMNCLLNEYLYYFYYREQAVENILHAEKTRGELIKELNEKMFAELKELNPQTEFPQCLKIFAKYYGQREMAYMANETGKGNHINKYSFDVYGKDDGGYAGVALNYIAAEQTGLPTKMIMCVPNEGAIADLQADDVVEISCTIRDGKLIRPKITDITAVQLNLIKNVKLYERLASEALRERSIAKAVDCLMVHPLVNSYSLAKKLVGEYIQLNRDYSKGWH